MAWAATATTPTLGQIATVTYPDTHPSTRQLDKAGRLQSVTDWNNQTTSFGYDGDGNGPAKDVGIQLVTVTVYGRCP